jgi:2-polyprenyl-6-methoxyphenol hydroxylase-like FAD-dependent oxidoreductase
MVALNTRIGIVGTGTSGVFLASLLAKQGFQVDLFEKAPYARTDGCGILLVQAGMAALERGNSEICQKIIDAGVPAQLFEFRNLRGQVISSEPVSYAENELPGMLVHRKAILEALLDAIPSDSIHYNFELAAIAQNPWGVTAFFKNGQRWDGDLLIGADGIASKVRQSVVPGVQLSYLGDLVWRGVVGDRAFCPEGGFIVYTRGRGIYANFFDIGQGRTHWGFFIEKEREGSEIEGLKPQDRKIPALELAKLPDEAREVIEATPPDAIVSRYSYDIDPLPRLYQGRVVLIGDAAHAKSPTRARGMTAGFEDALALSEHLVQGKRIDEVLAAFQAERMPIVHEYQRTSRELSRKIGRTHKQAA